MWLRLTLVLLFYKVVVGSSDTKFSFRNATKNMHGNGDHKDVIRTEIKKFMSECGADTSDEDDDKHNHSSYGGGDYYNSRYNKNQNDQNRWDQNSHRSYGSNGQGYSSSYGNSNNNGNYGSSTNGQGYGSSGSSNSNGQGYGNSDSTYNQRDYSQSNYGSRGQAYGYSNSPGSPDYNKSGYGTYTYGQESNDYGRSSGGYRRDGFVYDGGYVRPKRSDDDIECISQCVFGYLEVLDVNRSPSETAMIKWIQDHMPNDGKRVKAIREARRCFARLAVSDNEDGCEFSKSLSKCLNLDIEN